MITKSWFVYIMLVCAIGASGCATKNRLFSASLRIVDVAPVVSRHGDRQVVFVNNLEKRSPSLIIKIRDTNDPSGAWLDQLTLDPTKAAVVTLDEGQYEAEAEGIGRQRFNVPAQGRSYRYDGCYYAAGVLIGGRR